MLAEARGITASGIAFALAAGNLEHVAKLYAKIAKVDRDDPQG